MKWMNGSWKYLGVPIAGKRLRKCDFAVLMMKIQGRLGHGVQIHCPLLGEQY